MERSSKRSFWYLWDTQTVWTRSKSLCICMDPHLPLWSNRQSAQSGTCVPHKMSQTVIFDLITIKYVFVKVCESLWSNHQSAHSGAFITANTYNRWGLPYVRGRLASFHSFFQVPYRLYINAQKYRFLPCGVTARTKNIYLRWGCGIENREFLAYFGACQSGQPFLPKVLPQCRKIHLSIQDP